MNNYHPPNPELWQGRTSGSGQYLHEQVGYLDLEADIPPIEPGFAILGYACDEGVRRNKGRIGAVEGPVSIKQELAKLPCPQGMSRGIWDAGMISCVDQDLETAQAALAERVKHLLDLGNLPILLGGGHDIAYGHYMGLRSHFEANESIGIINLDAHFDLRSSTDGPNSGTPFYQIAKGLEQQDQSFHYLCLGIREEANSTELFDTARELGVDWVILSSFNQQHKKFLGKLISDFIQKVDRVYLTIDLDGFSSAYAPGASAASPFGFDPQIALWTLNYIIATGKLISMDIAELNPKYDRDSQTAKLAAGLVHKVLGSTEFYSNQD